MFYKNGQSILVVKVTMKKYWKKLLDVLMRLLNLKKSYILKMSKNLEDSHPASKAYQNISDRSICNKKTPAIPLLFVYCNFISDFREKVSIFNNCFASIFTPRKNASLLFSYKTIRRRIFFKVTEKDILSIKKSLDSTKALIFFQESLKKGTSPQIWKN